MVEPTLFPNPAIPAPPTSKKQPVDVELLGKVSKNVNTIAANLRIIEERYSTLRNTSQVSEQSVIGLEKDVGNDIKLLSSDLVDLKREISDIKDKLRLISAELKNLVNKDEFRVMEHYLDMWQPMNFVTRNELGKLIEQKQKDKA